ncbi:unnamed protein product [Knipowitschia caucasica]
MTTCCHLDAAITISPLSLEGLSGSCLLIPCHFTVKNGSQYSGRNTAGVVWIKSKSQFKDQNSNVVFNTSRTAGNYPMKITGDMSQRDCTTEFSNLTQSYSDRYFFRVEDGDFKSTASCSAINITVRDSPWSPIITVSGAQTETQVVTVTCSAVTPCPGAPPRLTWNLHQDSASVTESSPNGTFTTKITHRITLTSSHNGTNITCFAAYPVNGKNKTTQATLALSVSESDAMIPKGEAAVVTWLPAVIVPVALISGFLLVWHFRCRRPQLQPPQVQTTEAVIKEPVHPEDSVLYGDLRFTPHTSTPKPKNLQEETVYSPVKVSSNIRQAVEMADVYAQIKKK